MTLASPSTTRPSAPHAGARQAAHRPSPALIGYGLAGGVSLTLWAAAIAAAAKLLG